MNRLSALASLMRRFVQTRRTAGLRGKALRIHQDRHAQRILAYAMTRSPFYRRHFSGLDLKKWREFPTVDKRTMMANFDEFTTRGIHRDAAMKIAVEAEASGNYQPSLGELTVGLSSGTSGYRGLFVVDPWERAVWAGTVLARALPPLRRKGFKVVLLLRSGSKLYDTIGSKWLQFRFCDLMTPIPNIVAMLNQFSPDIVVGPPSMLALLAAEKKASRLNAAPLRIVSVAEVLEPVDQAAIADAFGGPVHQIYQCTEGVVAMTCREGNLHVLEDFVAVQYEPVGEDPARVTPILTDLYRRSQPILRYRLNDILVLEPAPCACGSGFQRIARIEGRQDDVFYFNQDNGSLRMFFPDVLRRIVLLATGGIVDYEIIQDRPGALRIHVATTGGEFAALEASLRTSAETILKQYGCTADSIEIVNGLMSRRPDQKRRRVRREGQVGQTAPR